mmetsp:Transcript_33876/g.24921  ORF Transcript_33876/g.24921 Transcript_33876/m.24921 type:complete len:147 (+) Transcript_33876:2523-2963(+)
MKIKEHFTFRHPVFFGKNSPGKQQLMFNDSLDIMLEVLVENRLFLYKKTPLGLGNSKEVAWQRFHRFHNIPIMVMATSQFPFIFSPDLQHYLDLNIVKKQFVIRRCEGEEPVVYIPLYLMDPRTESPVALANRFSWKDNKTLWIVN